MTSVIYLSGGARQVKQHTLHRQPTWREPSAPLDGKCSKAVVPFQSVEFDRRGSRDMFYNAGNYR